MRKYSGILVPNDPILQTNGLVLDFDPAKDVTLDFSSANTVNSWTDKFGNIASSINTTRPIYDTTGLNGLPSLYFDGFDDYLSLPSTSYPQFGATTGMTFIQVVAPYSGNVNASFAISNSLNAGSARAASRFGNVSPTNSLGISARRRDNDSIYNDTTAATQFVANEVFCMSHIFNYVNDNSAAAYTIRKNGTIVYGPQTVATSNGATHAITAGTCPLGGINVGLPTNTIGVSMGGVLVNGLYNKFRQGRLLVFNRVLNTYEIARIEAYLMSLYGITNISISTPLVDQMYQVASGVQNIAITGTYTGSPTNIQARVIGTIAGGTAYTGAWTTIVTGASGGTYSGTLSNVPQGQFTLQTRFSNDTTQTCQRTGILVSDIYLLGGQSNNTDVTGGDRNTVDMGGVMFPVAFDSSNLYAQCFNVNGDSSFWPLFAKEYFKSFKIPCGFICAAIGGTNIQKWQPTDATYAYPGNVGGDQFGVGQNLYNRLVSMVAAATLGTGFKKLFWHQGEANCGGTALAPTMTTAVYKAFLDTIQTQFASDFPGAKFMPAKLQRQFSQLNQETYTGAINAAIQQAWDQGGVYAKGPDFSDLMSDMDPILSNGRVHLLKGANQNNVAKRWAAAVAADESWPSAA
jgi:hypothetical protein